jgi:hypothetical protein
MMKKLALLFTALLGSAFAFGQDEILINPDTAYAEADATAAEIEAVSSIYNASGYELDVYWQRDTTVLPPGWSVDFCEKNGCFPASAQDTIFTISQKENAPLSAVFRPNGIPGTGWMRVRLYSGSSGLHFEKKAVFIATATGETATGEEEIATGIALFPNPADRELTVVAADANFKGSWTVANAAGQTVLTQPNAPAIGQLDVSTLSAGLYILHVRTKDGRLVAAKKFSVQ